MTERIELLCTRESAAFQPPGIILNPQRSIYAAYHHHFAAEILTPSRTTNQYARCAKREMQALLTKLVLPAQVRRCKAILTSSLL